MRFQTKMIAMYAVFMFIVAFVLGLFYHEYTIRQYEKAEEKSLEAFAEQMVNQADGILTPMELAANYILSDTNVREGITMLAKKTKGLQDEGYKEDARTDIRLGINTDYIVRHFYRTIFFNQLGEVENSINNEARKCKSTVDFIAMPWLSKADEAKGKSVLINAHEDTWGLGDNPQVFSLLKAIQGKNMGYIEVQKRIADLEEEIQIPREGLDYMIFINGDELLYSSNKRLGTDYAEIVNDLNKAANPFHMKDGEELIVKAKSENFPVTILLIEDMESVNQRNAYMVSMTFLIAFVFFCISMIFVIILSGYLTRPIRELRTVMEHTKLENIGKEIQVNTANNEIEALSLSYQNVLERLRASIIKEKRLSMLQLQAQFDTLQSQVNPHFLYNVLNVIASRGMTDGDETICEMCGSLASMLRYSTSSVERYATVLDELNYLEQYFYLLKARYDYKFSYSVSVDEKLYKQILPKMVLQQIVENCVNHGFQNSTEHMHVEITGWSEADAWYIKVHDNGQGFEEEMIQNLKKKFEKTKHILLKERNNMELEIGGMGLVNTYARLLLIYNDHLTFCIKNGEEGADVMIGVALRREDSDVQSYGN